ncbi:hypothetical protein PGUG_00328 [Meyerozyma guilliermondii ATCC 6260]|uniref:Small ribosomal subunit protein uS4m n=1 Tax=Meyerozyma guilliermondii (strain ATCC 6260 / CBS 566 / DSM 6381 / JCM 1539 / NBRC 10279 / NRRL Y-324) TaxID=294746 RepID=A5DAM3_PICGU|nr:uncharacterized protein PGUG_00328 [Meyerozyma guilliermondii ATCC 6260]EDK36230.1 hypothetical protein PGUG_00328 [Meyerozyma guilliermondii ATCC 6260]
MPRRTQNLNSMARGRVRASMNKYNLFNLYKKPNVNYQGKTLFQQKWTAKAETRAYHGEHLTEGRWKQLFKPNLESVAQLDASLKGMDVALTPMPLQTYAALEKRLEFAMFRAMFASSVRQARQYILNGYVKVNGVIIKHPSFPLKSGDIFSVIPEKVLTAMGRTKPSVQKAISVDSTQIAAWNKYVKTAKTNPQETWQLKQAKPKSLDPLIEQESLTHKEQVKRYNEQIEKSMLAKQKSTTRDTILSRIITLGNQTEEVSPNTFEEFGKENKEKCYKAYTLLKENDHALLKDSSVESAAAFISKKAPDFGSKEETKLASSIKQVLSEVVKSQHEHIRISSNESKLPEDIKSIPFSPQFAENLRFHPPLEKEAILEDESKASINLPWQRGLFGRQDPAKPYFTPWTPRPFIGCFAVLPSHLEVSFSTCHAVYLRDPVARPGHSEVISPFPDHVHERAYMYYARKGM